MASALKELRSLQKEFTCCEICFSVYKQPKMLPCLHTFCFQCLVDYLTKATHSEIRCPVCRGSIPKTVEDLQALPTNFFINRLLEMKVLTDDDDTSKAVYCDACSAGASSPADCLPESRLEAVMYCLDCKERLCGECVGAHKKVKMTKEHKLIELGVEYRAKLREAIKNSPVNCEAHEDERLVFFCLNCSQPICMKCCVLQHKDHTYLDIAEAAKRFKSGLDQIIETATVNLTKCSSAKELCRQQRQRLFDKKRGLEKVFEERMTLLQEEIEKQKKLMVEELSQYNESKTMELDEFDVEVDGKSETLATFQKFCQELKDNGTNIDIVTLSNQFIARARELEHAGDIEIKTTIDLNFKAGTTDKTMALKVGELFGKFAQKAPVLPPTAGNKPEEKPVSQNPSQEPKPNPPGKARNIKKRDIPNLTSACSDTFQPNASLSSVVYGKLCIQGVVLMHDKLYIVRNGSPMIEVYDGTGEGMNLDRHYQIPGLANATDMTADDTSLTLFIGDWSSSSIFRMVAVLEKGCTVGLRADGKFQTFGHKPNGLSLSTRKTILIACTADKQLLEYTPQGQLIRIIETLIYSPRHAVELSSNDFAVVSGDDASSYVVSKMSISGDGKVVFHRQFGGETAPVFCRLNEAKHVAVCPRTGLLYLADCKNDRVLALNSIFRTAGPPLIGKDRVINPNRVCLNVDGSSMYVGCMNGSLIKLTLTPVQPAEFRSPSRANASTSDAGQNSNQFKQRIPKKLKSAKASQPNVTSNPNLDKMSDREKVCDAKFGLIQ